MNKEEIKKILNTIFCSKDKYVLANNTSLVFQGILKTTETIEIFCLKKLNIKENLQNFKITFCDIKSDEVVIIDDFKCLTLEQILRQKRIENKKEDIKIIKNIELELAKKDNYLYEKALIEKGITLIAGVDEVGRGPLVGPVVAAAVILPLNFKLDGLTDSKKLSEKKRNEFDKIIKQECISYAIAEVSNDVIDKINIYEATKIAMKTAIEKLNPKPEHVLIDAMKLDSNIPETSIIKGDIKSLSIAAASVLAKVYRDSLMYELDKKYPYYNYKKNKGYPTKEHIEALYKYGTLKCYRKSYNPVSLIEKVNPDEI